MTQFNSAKFSKAVKKKRGKLTLRECEAVTGINHAAIHRYEKCNIVPDAKTLFDLCEWLGADMRDFFTSK